jgi:ADP-L-glycero-D-manno-heptose 6-epimerase
MKSEPIIVTGGAGFIGSAIIWALNERGHDNVFVCDRLDSDERWRNLAPLHFRDFVDADELPHLIERNALGEIRAIIHLGASSSTTERDMGLLMRNNFFYTRNLARLAISNNIRFIYASSAATYGAEAVDRDETGLEKLRPMNPYGFSKQLFDIYAMREGWLSGIVGLKYFNIFGPNENHKGAMRSFVHKAFEQIRSTNRIELFKSHRPGWDDGRQCRDFLYVKDAVEMTLYLAERPNINGIFNVGSGKSHTWIELAEAVFAAMEVPPEIVFVDMPESLRSSYQYETRAAMGKLAAAGYSKCATPLAEAVKDCVTNYLIPDLRLGERL